MRFFTGHAPHWLAHTAAPLFYPTGRCAATRRCPEINNSEPVREASFVAHDPSIELGAPIGAPS